MVLCPLYEWPDLGVCFSWLTPVRGMKRQNFYKVGPTGATTPLNGLINGNWGYFTPISGVITLLTTGRGPPCTHLEGPVLPLLCSRKQSGFFWQSKSIHVIFFTDSPVCWICMSCRHNFGVGICLFICLFVWCIDVKTWKKKRHWTPFFGNTWMSQKVSKRLVSWL